ncbi:hypothetical protein IFR05_014102 [Cadophora sp. M221]|nr:hypothetical protein IFR05_014102 [Cadophora sp. M221]
MSRRQSLADRLNGIANNFEDEFTLETLKEVFEMAREGEGFRYTAPTTQNRQDLHLKELLRFTRATQMLGEEFSADDVKTSLFSGEADESPAVPDVDPEEILDAVLDETRDERSSPFQGKVY